MATEYTFLPINDSSKRSIELLKSKGFATEIAALKGVLSLSSPRYYFFKKKINTQKKRFHPFEKKSTLTKTLEPNENPIPINGVPGASLF